MDCTNTIGKDKRAGRDARSISFLLRVTVKGRKTDPHPATKSLQEIGLGGIREFDHVPLLEHNPNGGEKNVVCVSFRAGTHQQKSHRMIRLLILMTCDQQLIKHPNVDNGLIIK